MIRFLAAALLLIAGVSPAFASSTGGDVAAVSSSSPCLVATPSAGPSVSVALTAQSQVIDETGTSGYTAATTDACKTVKIGAASGTPTLTVPPAGTFPTNWGAALYENVGSVNAPVSVQSGSFDGAGGVSSFTLPENAWAILTPETSGNWLATISTPTLTASGPQLVQHPAGCHNSGAGTTVSCTIAATGSGGHALIVNVQECTGSTCASAGNGNHLSITAPAGCTLITGAVTTAAQITAASFQCPNVASGVTTVTASTSDSGAFYLSAKVLEWSNVPTSAPIAEGGASTFDNTGTDTTASCTTGTVTSGDVVYAVDASSPAFTVASPFTLIDSDAVSGYGDAEENAGSTTTYTANFTHSENWSAATCFGIKP